MTMIAFGLGLGATSSASGRCIGVSEKNCSNLSQGWTLTRYLTLVAVPATTLLR
jgi:hypothetical protein